MSIFDAIQADAEIDHLNLEWREWLERKSNEKKDRGGVMKKEPRMMVYCDIRVVRISDVGEEFRKWLDGQTLPYIDGDDNPSDWAYFWDYSRWIYGLPVID